jgi:hypothetical protein
MTTELTKHKINYYRVIEYFIIGLAFFIALTILIPPASAIDPPNQSYVTVTKQYNGAVDPPEYHIERIAQGSNVYLNGTYDISGVTGWENMDDGFNYLEWCGGYDCYDESDPYILKLPIKTVKQGSESQYHYWINPDIFSTRTGYWFQHSDISSEQHGNTVAFKVVSAWYNTSVTYPNGTVMMTSNLTEGNITVIGAQRETILPERPVSDWLQVRGERMDLTVLSPEKIWVFGRYSNYYDFDTFGTNVTITPSVTQTWEPGSYYLLHQYPGKNGEYDVRYYNDSIQIKTGWDGIKNIPINGVQPKLVEEKVEAAIRSTDDTFKVERLEVEDPEITVSGFNEIPLSEKYNGYQYYRTEKGIVSLFDVRGYTNVNNGTKISVVLDPDDHTVRDISRYTFTTEAIRNLKGNESMYQAYVPIIWDDMTVGIHTLKVTTADGGTVFKNFPISILPEDSFKPNATIKYVADENPWKPNLTVLAPIIITKTIEVPKIIEVTVTPSQQSVNEAQLNAIMNIGTIIGECLIGAVAIFLVARFLYRSSKKRRWYKK